jgi:hypothetical protein
MKSRAVLFVLAAAVLISGTSYAGWKYLRARASRVCAACERPVHQTTRTVALIGDKRAGFCCPACSLSQHHQSGKPVQVLSLTDHLTGARIEPSRAFLVRGSDVNPCSHQSAALMPDKHPAPSHYDRCSPSLLAFSNESAARGFARQHGGQLLDFAQMTALFR